MYYLDHNNLADDVSLNVNNFFSSLNYGHAYYEDLFFIGRAFQNTGIGRSLGLEVLLEKTFVDNTYILFTGSLYDAKYRGFRDVWRNTAFNGNYSFHATLAKPFLIHAMKKDNFQINLSTDMVGGRRYTAHISGTNFIDEENTFDNSILIILEQI